MSDVCSSDLIGAKRFRLARAPVARSAVAGEDETDRRMLPVAKVAASDLEQAHALCAAIDVAASGGEQAGQERRPHRLHFLADRIVEDPGAAAEIGRAHV